MKHLFLTLANLWCVAMCMGQGPSYAMTYGIDPNDLLKQKNSEAPQQNEQNDAKFYL